MALGTSRRARLAALTAAALLAAVPAGAYVRSKVRGTEICTYWPVRTVEYWMNREGSPDIAAGAVFPAIRNGFGNWTGTTCSDIGFADRGLTDERRVGFERGRPPLDLVVFRTTTCDDVVPPSDPCIAAGDCRNAHFCWEGPLNAIALTTTTYSARSGEIFDADIELNDAGRKFAVLTEACSGASCDADDVENTVTHEVGHVIGFDHESNPTSVMSPSAVPGEIKKRRLSPDDVGGLCAVYPRSKPPVPCISPPDRVVVGGCMCQSLAAAFPASLALAPFALRRRHGARNRPSDDGCQSRRGVDARLPSHRVRSRR